MTTPAVQLRVYDDRLAVPQPTGPVAIEVPDDATDDQIVEAISELADHSRPFRIRRVDGCINPGWLLIYA